MFSNSKKFSLQLATKSDFFFLRNEHLFTTSIRPAPTAHRLEISASDLGLAPKRGKMTLILQIVGSDEKLEFERSSLEYSIRQCDRVPRVLGQLKITKISEREMLRSRTFGTRQNQGSANPYILHQKWLWSWIFTVLDSG